MASRVDYVKSRLRLFDELLISEIDLCSLMANYVFPKPHYDNELRNLNIDPTSIKTENYNNVILKNRDKINFRMKHIIFMGYKSKSNNVIWFLQLTSIKKKIFDYPVYYMKFPSYQKIYIKTNKIYQLDLDSLTQLEYSKKNRNKGNIVQDNKWKNEMLIKLTSRIKKTLKKWTDLNIYNDI